MKKLLTTSLILGCAVIMQNAADAQSHYEPYAVTTLAGTPPGHANGTGSAARFNSPTDIATGDGGNIFVSDYYNHTIRKITPAGAVTTLAGAPEKAGSADGTGSAARFRNPQGIAVDHAGNIYVADEFNHTIRKITPTGKVTTLAGKAGKDGSADGVGSVARFYYPTGVAVDDAGAVYVGDQGNNTVRKITPAGVVSTIAGTAGKSGDTNGIGKAARFNTPWDVAVSTAGNVYVADIFNNTIRKITPNGVVTTLVPKVNGGGPLGFPSGVAVDGAENVYVAASLENKIYKVAPNGTFSLVAGGDARGSADGTRGNARFNDPSDVARDNAGNLYVADSLNETVRKITPAGVVTTLAGTVSPGHKDGTLSAARIDAPWDVAINSHGEIYVADTGNTCVRKITPAGNVSTFASGFSFPAAVAVGGSGDVYVADRYNETIDKITPAGVVSTFAGAAGQTGSTDGAGAAARFFFPAGATTDSAGNVYVADTQNCTIRKITPAGVVSTLAGSAGNAGSADGTGSEAQFRYPYGISAGSAGNVYVADRGNHTIRKVTPAGKVTTVAGLAGSRGSADGTGSAARFNNPSGVKVDSVGNLYVADTYNKTIRKITPEGVVTTLAGMVRHLSAHNGTGKGAGFWDPSNLAVAPNGKLYIADTRNNTIRVATPAAPDAETTDGIEPDPESAPADDETAYPSETETAPSND